MTNDCWQHVQVTFAVVVATTFGDPEMQAVAKLAQKMPEGDCMES